MNGKEEEEVAIELKVRVIISSSHHSELIGKMVGQIEDKWGVKIEKVNNSNPIPSLTQIKDGMIIGIIGRASRKKEPNFCWIMMSGKGGNMLNATGKKNQKTG
jgi:hypothetical protein